MEVRFVDDGGVHEQVRTAVADALLDAGLLRSTAPRGRSQPDQTEIAPETSADATADSSDETADAASTDDTDTADSAATTPEPQNAQETVSSRATEDDTPTTQDSSASADSNAADWQRNTTADAESGATHSEPSDDRELSPDRKFAGDRSQARLGDDPETPHDRLPSMRILGQLQETYVVAETGDGLVLVDQHAADERVNYERLRRQFRGETTTQALADPVTLELTAREAAVFEERTDALASLGFHTARTGERTIEVRTLPGVIADAAGPDIVRDVLDAFVGGEREATTTVEEAADELLWDLACYPSVTGNTPLTEGSVRDLLSALDDCENPYACPHGRPTVIEIDSEELEDRFERDYPGHAGRRE